MEKKTYYVRYEKPGFAPWIYPADKFTMDVGEDSDYVSLRSESSVYCFPKASVKTKEWTHEEVEDSGGFLI